MLKRTLGDLITELYDEFFEMNMDRNLAAVATAAAINELLAEQAFEPYDEVA